MRDPVVIEMFCIFTVLVDILVMWLYNMQDVPTGENRVKSTRDLFILIFTTKCKSTTIPKFNI